MKRILVVSYLFDPSKEIGARRWSMLAKSFTNLGYEVDVLTNSNGDCNFIKNKYLFSSFYPSILTKAPKTVLDKLKYRFWDVVFKIISKGTSYDKTLLSGKKIAKKTSQLIKEIEYHYVIVSGAPFNMLFHIIKLRSKYNLVKFVTDLRDPWTWDSNYGMTDLSSKKFNYEKRKERYVIEKSDFITVPAITMKKYIYEEYGINAYHLPHFYKEMGIKNKEENVGVIKLIYGGALYKDSLIDIVNFISKAKVVNFKKRIEYNIFSESNIENVRQEFFQMNVSQRVEERALFEKITGSDYYLAFYPSRFKDFISSKILEIVSLGTPIILISEEGDLSNFILENNLGSFYSISDLDKFIQDLSEDKICINYNQDFDIVKYEVTNVSKKLLSHLDGK